MPDKISIVIPCYWIDQSFVDMTKKCLEGLDSSKFEMILVDDGSPQTSDIATIVLPENKGYAGAVNTGLRASTGDYIIVCNNDIEFIQPDWLDHILKPLEEGYAISCIRTSDSDGYTVENRYEDDAKFGSIWALKRETYEALGDLDESFGRGYFEDQDYWRRLKDSGLKCVKNHNGLVHHAGKATFEKLGDTHLLKAMFQYKRKWGDKAHVFEHAPNSVVLVDDYDMDNPGYAYALQTRELQMEEIEKRWPELMF